MKSKIEQYAKGDFYVEYPDIKLAKNYLQLKIEAGSVYTDCIPVTSGNGIPMKMMVYDDAYLLRFAEHSIIGVEESIVFTFDATRKKRGSIYSGVIHLIGNGIEKELPYSIEIVAPFKDDNGIAIEDLMKFSALAESDWERALQMFGSDEFESALLGSNTDYVEAYRTLKDAVNRSQALEEFLVYTHKKRALTLQMEHDRFQYNYPKMREQHQITLHKNTWGYCRMQIRTDSDFIILNQTEICSMEFDGDNATIYYSLDPDKLNENENAIGHIFLENTYQKMAANIIIRKAEEPSRILIPKNHDYHLKKQEIASLMHNYLDYRVGILPLDRFVRQTRETLNHLLTMEPETGIYKLGLLHMNILNGKEDIVREELRRMDADRDQTVLGTKEHCYYLYLKALVTKEKEQAEKACKEIERALAKEEDKLFYFWLLIYMDDRYQRDSKWLFSQIEGLYEGGYQSPILSLEICDLFNAEPLLLRKLSIVEIGAIKFGLDNQYLSEEVEREFLELAAKEKDFRPQVFSLLSTIYDLRKRPEIIKIICSMLIKGGKTDTQYHKYYEEGIKCGYHIVGIQENFLRSMDHSHYELIPDSLLRYFNYKGILTEHEYAYLYANVIVNKRRYLGQYEEYLPNMEAFMEEQILKGNINDDLSILYSELLKPQMVKPSYAASLVKVIFKRKLTVGSDNISAVVVSHRELKEELVIPVIDGVAYVDMITESAVVALVDDEQNRYVSTIPYKLQKLVDESLYMDILSQYAGDDFRYVLYQYDLLSAYDATDAKEVNVARDILSYSQISDEIKQQSLYGIVRYYYANLDPDILESYLTRIDPDYIAPADAPEYVNYLLSCEMYEEAFRAIKRFGYQGISVELLVKLVENLKDMSQYAKEETLLSVAAYLYRMGQDTLEVLSYMVDEYQSGLKDMLHLWKRVSGRLSRLDMLEENILCVTLYTEQWYDDVYSVFADYVAKKRTGMVIKAFFKRASFAYLIEEKEVPSAFFDALFYQMHSDKLEDDMCRAALILYFSQKTKLEEEELDWIKEETETFMKRGIMLPFFRNFKKYFKLPKDLFMMTYVVTCDKAGKQITFQYGIQSGVEKPDCNKTARMLEVLPGYYIKEFVLFHGENLLYEMPEENIGRTRIYESEAMRSKGETEEYANRFEMLNSMLLNQEAGENQMVIDKIDRYLKLAAIVDENLVLME